jgi:hypothetical protein
VLEAKKRAHNPEIAGSNPAPATRKVQVRGSVRTNRTEPLSSMWAECGQTTATRLAEHGRMKRDIGCGLPVGCECCRLEFWKFARRLSGGWRAGGCGWCTAVGCDRLLLVGEGIAFREVAFAVVRGHLSGGRVDVVFAAAAGEPDVAGRRIPSRIGSDAGLTLRERTADDLIPWVPDE